MPTSTGRFVLGAGQPGEGHNERRLAFLGPRRHRLRGMFEPCAIWRCWQTGEELRHEGEHYRLTLMTRDFSPEPTGLPMVR